MFKQFSRDFFFFLAVLENYKKQQRMQQELNLVYLEPEAAAIEDEFPCGTASPVL